MIVTQSHTNFICPIRQLEMKKPVKNKVCGHTYKEEAIVHMIESKRKKKSCCPEIGCSHTNVKMSDLIQDKALRRAIEKKTCAIESIFFCVSIKIQGNFFKKRDWRFYFPPQIKYSLHSSFGTEDFHIVSFSLISLSPEHIQRLLKLL